MQPRRATDIGVVDESTCRKATGLRHLATSKWGTLREAIRHTDRPQKHSIADERTLSDCLRFPPISILCQLSRSLRRRYSREL